MIFFRADAESSGAARYLQEIDRRGEALQCNAGVRYDAKCVRSIRERRERGTSTALAVRRCPGIHAERGVHRWPDDVRPRVSGVTTRCDAQWTRRQMESYVTPKVVRVSGSA